MLELGACGKGFDVAACIPVEPRQPARLAGAAGAASKYFSGIFAAGRIDVTTQDILINEPRATDSRPDRLTQVLSSLRAGTSAGRLALVVIGIGLLLIGLGWNGMAGSGGEVNGVPNLNAQLPWLLSGGILGLALVVFGAALLIAHNARADRMQLEAKLGEILDSLSGPITPAEPASARSASRSGGGFRAGATAFHRADCRLVEGRDDLESVTRKGAETLGLRPCRVCKPA